jgi:MoaA/NifB/PqqE/SkfB family radical SAM enzyme
MAQIDPNGLCNVGCWFCPVSHGGNPAAGRADMPIETLRSVIEQLMAGKGTFVSDNFDFVYTAHYNEVLLYKYFEEMLQLFREHGLRTIVLTNGTPLTKAKVDIIKEYQDVVYGICLNVPAAEEELWAQYTGKNPKMFSKLMENIQYAIDSLPAMFESKNLSIQINGVTEESLASKNGWITLLENAPDIDLRVDGGDLDRQYNLFLERFPGINAYKMPNLIDRAGHLDKMGVMTNIDGIKKYAQQDKTRVIGCGNGIEVGGRPNGWIHINANGALIICCNDFDFETVFGNVNEKPIKDIWMSIDHKEMVLDSYKSLCTTCAHAIWE